ncbi:MAG TPA: hypothetical protein VH475_22620 [Tepidisphaeraceae bacterium]|jgi:hypothetical protein
MRIRILPLLAIFAFSVLTFAEDKKDAPNIDGTWTWTYKLRDGTEGTAKLKLKREAGDKVTGTYIAREGDQTPVENGQIKGNQLSFDVNRIINEQKMKFEYHGQIAGDTITGKIIFGRDKPLPHDWEAKRAKE